MKAFLDKVSVKVQGYEECARKGRQVMDIAWCQSMALEKGMDQKSEGAVAQCDVKAFIATCPPSSCMSGWSGSSVAAKSLMGRMEREIRHFSDLGEEAYEQALPDELIKNLLYYVGLAERGGDELNAVKDAYHLDLYLPQGETLEELRQY